MLSNGICDKACWTIACHFDSVDCAENQNRTSVPWTSSADTAQLVRSAAKPAKWLIVMIMVGSYAAALKDLMNLDKSCFVTILAALLPIALGPEPPTLLVVSDGQIARLNTTGLEPSPDLLGAESISNLMAFALRQFPAAHSGLILSGEYLMDLTSPMNDDTGSRPPELIHSLSLKSIVNALERTFAFAKDSTPLEFVAFDSGVVGSFETLSAFSPFAHYVLAPPYLSPAFFWGSTFIIGLGRTEAAGSSWLLTAANSHGARCDLLLYSVDESFSQFCYTIQKLFVEALMLTNRRIERALLMGILRAAHIAQRFPESLRAIQLASFLSELAQSVSQAPTGDSRLPKSVVESLLVALERVSMRYVEFIRIGGCEAAKRLSFNAHFSFTGLPHADGLSIMDFTSLYQSLKHPDASVASSITAAGAPHIAISNATVTINQSVFNAFPSMVRFPP
jgi:hypothetical protein